MKAINHREDFLTYARSKALLHNSKEYFRSKSLGSLSQCDAAKTPLPPYDCHRKALPHILTEFLAKTYNRKCSPEGEQIIKKVKRGSSMIRQITPIVLASSICEETYDSQTHFEDEGEQQEQQKNQGIKRGQNIQYSQASSINFDNYQKKHHSWHKNESFSERNISRWVSRQDNSFLEQSFLDNNIIPPIQSIRHQLTRSRSIQESFSELTIQQYQQHLQQIQSNNLLVPINNNKNLMNSNQNNTMNSITREKRNQTKQNSNNLNIPTKNILLDSHQIPKHEINKLGKVQVLYSYNHAKSSSVLSPSIDLSSFLTKRMKAITTTTTTTKGLEELKALSKPINDTDNLSSISQSTARGVPSSQRTSITSQHQAPSVIHGNLQSQINSYQRKRKISETRSSLSSIPQHTHIPTNPTQNGYSNQQLISDIDGTSRDKINISQILITEASSSGSPSPRKRFLSQQIKKSLPPKKIRSKKTLECCDEIIDFIPQMRDDLEKKILKNPEYIAMIEQKLMLSISEFLFMLTQFWKFCAENPSDAEIGFAIFKLNMEHINMIEINLKQSLFDIPLPEIKKQLFLESFTRHSRKLMIPLNLVEHIGGEIHAAKILTNYFQVLKADIAIGNSFTKILEGIDIPHACKLFYALLNGEYSEIDSILPQARNVLSLSSEEFLLMKLRFSEVLLQETLLSLEDKMIVLERFEKLRTYILQDTFLVNLLHSGDDLQAVLHSNRELLSLIKEHDRAYVKVLADSTLQALFGRTTLAEFKNHLSSMFLSKNSDSSNSNSSTNPVDHERNDHLFTIVSLLESSVVPFVQQKIISKHQAYNTAQHTKLKFEFLKEDIAKKYSQAVQNSGKPIALALRTWAIDNFRKYLKHIEVTEIENSRLEFMTAFLRLYFYRKADVFSYFDIPIASKHFAFNDTALEFWMIGLKEVLGDSELKLDLKQSEIEIIILNISNILTYSFKAGATHRDSSPLSPLKQKLPQIITKKNTISNEQEGQIKSSGMDRSPSPNRKLLIFSQKDGSISPTRERFQTSLIRNNINSNTLLRYPSISDLKS